MNFFVISFICFILFILKFKLILFNNYFLFFIKKINEFFNFKGILLFIIKFLLFYFFINFFQFFLFTIQNDRNTIVSQKYRIVKRLV